MPTLTWQDKKRFFQKLTNLRRRKLALEAQIRAILPLLPDEKPSVFLKLTDRQRLKIGDLAKSGDVTIRALAKKFSVSVGTISRVLDSPKPT